MFRPGALISLLFVCGSPRHVLLPFPQHMECHAAHVGVKIFSWHDISGVVGEEGGCVVGVNTFFTVLDQSYTVFLFVEGTGRGR